MSEAITSVQHLPSVAASRGSSAVQHKNTTWRIRLSAGQLRNQPCASAMAARLKEKSGECHRIEFLPVGAGGWCD
jgi:hypothetical protein